MKSRLDVGLINQCVYQAEAHAFDQQRNRALFEKPWLDQFLALLDSGSHVLDLGCGSGRPISEYMIHQGHHVTGLDFAPKMLQVLAQADV